MSVNCVYCGHVNPDGSTVCLSCGRTLPPAPSGGPSYGQQPQQPPQQPPQSWGAPQQPPPPPQAPSYPPPNPYGGSYPPPPDPSSGWQGGYGNQPGAAPPQAPPSYGNQPGFGAPGYQQQQPPAPSYGQTPGAWGVEPQGYAAANPEGQSAKQMATIALVVSCVGLLIGWCCMTGIVLGPTGAILGFLARGKLARNNVQEGQGIALAAMIIGGLVFVIPILLLVLQLLFGIAGGAFGR
jgi:hypothetical protein